MNILKMKNDANFVVRQVMESHAPLARQKLIVMVMAQINVFGAVLPVPAGLAPLVRLDIMKNNSMEILKCLVIKNFTIVQKNMHLTN